VLLDYISVIIDVGDVGDSIKAKIPLAKAPNNRSQTPTMTSTTALNKPLRILFLGATGYIGGSILDRLITHPSRSSFEIVSFSRNADKAKKLEAEFGIKTVLGSLDDVQKIEAQAAKTDIVFHTAESADHLPSAQAILRGLKKRHEETGKVPVYIHCVCLYHSVRGKYTHAFPVRHRRDQ
jgi:hypothetical protein